MKSLRERRIDTARTVDAYTFEPAHERDIDNDGFPDFWRPESGPGYLVEKVRIVPDDLRRGATPGEPGHVLALPYSGEPGGIGVETRVPRLVDSHLAYEISLFARTEGLDGSVVSLDIIWLNVDEKGEETILGPAERIVVPRGQRDWSEKPLSRRVNDLDERANRVRFVCRVEDDPSVPGADRHGTARFDDIRITSRPKIRMESVFLDTDAPLAIPVVYQGLVDNVPNEDGVLQGKEYSRKIEITDIEGRRVLRQVGPVDPGADTRLREVVTPGLDRRGVYYVNVTLYGLGERRQADARQVVGRWPPPLPARRGAGDGGNPDRFGVTVDPFVLRRLDDDTGGEGDFRDRLAHLGVHRLKVDVLPPPAVKEWPAEDLDLLFSFLERWRGRGMRFTGVLGRPPLALTGVEPGMRPVMQDHAEKLTEHIRPAVTALGRQIDDWQWGTDTDPSFSSEFDPGVLSEARRALRVMSNAFIQALPVQPEAAGTLPEPEATEAVQIRVPADMSEEEMLKALAPLLPTRFARLAVPEQAVYAPKGLLRLARRHAEDRINRFVPTDLRRQRVWIDIEPDAVDPLLREQAGERTQLVELARKAILATVVGADRIFVGDFTDTERGLVTVTRSGRVDPRPSLPAVRTLAEHLSDAEYIGSYQLGDEVPNYVFRIGPEERKQALLALWYTGDDITTRVDIGAGGDMVEIDMAGNVTPLGRRMTIEVGAAPKLIGNILLPLARTRMSIRILEEPSLESISEWQQQYVHLRNWFAYPLQGSIRIVYALDETFWPERQWKTLPKEIKLRLPESDGDVSGERVEGRFPYEVRPSRMATVQADFIGLGERSSASEDDEHGARGRKYVQFQVTLETDGVYRFNLLRETMLESPIDLEIRQIRGERNELGYARAALTVVWRPDPKQPFPPRLLMKPYYVTGNDMESWQPTMTIQPSVVEERPALRTLRIPWPPRGERIAIGLEEENGPRFLRVDVTDLLERPEEEADVRESAALAPAP